MSRLEPRPHQEQQALATAWSQRNALIPRTVVQPLQAFLATEAAGGVILLVAALVALVWANSPWSGSYEQLWGTELTLSVGGWGLSEDLRHWVNDLLMAVFFFVIGLEVKREIVHGTLRDVRLAAVPLLCALGGMVVPALLYTALNVGGEGAAGWGIPMATDIAFALGVLALLGDRAPTSLKAFLLTLAVADDIGAIAVIALFYSDGLDWSWLLVAVVIVLVVVGLGRAHVRHLVVYVLAAGGLWLAVFESGLHATLAGVALGLLTPSRPFQEPAVVAVDAVHHLESEEAFASHSTEDDESILRHVGGLVDEAVSPLSRLEHSLHPWTSFVVLPVFALANAGVQLGGRSLDELVTEPVTAGVLVGLVLGKPLGVLGAGLLAVAVGLRLPEGIGRRQLLGVGLLAGIGFTVSIFVAGLAFEQGPSEEAAKLGILVASLLAGASGAAVLGVSRTRREKRPE